jgi:hypothetical protein
VHLSPTSSAPIRRLAALLPVAALALLQGCGGSGRAQSNANVTASTEISVTASGTTVLQPGGTVTLTASVVTDPNNQGVTWTLTGVGALSDVTTTKATYTAPAAGTVTGAVSVVITATGVHDTTQSASGTVRVNGTPVMQSNTFFPGNVGTAYGAAVAVLGGLAPFTWEVSSTTPLPPGLALCTTNCTSLSYTTITGTPTTVGSYPFTIKVTDANSATSTVDLTLTINAATACLVNGQFAQLETGFISGRMFVAAGSYNVVTAGTVTGHQDQGAATVVDEPVTGTCTTRTSNNGTLTITGTKRSPTYDYALTIGLDKARTQLMNGGDATSSTGQMLKQDATAFNAAALAGEWAFGTIGSYAPVGKDAGQRLGVAGRLTVDAAGAVTAGRLDTNTRTSATSFIGTMGAPDANGRGTLTLTGGAAYKFIYYVVNANKLFIVQTDSTGGAPVLAGTMTRQALPYSGASLSSQGILSLWGAYGTDTPHASVALGRLSGATATDLYTGKLQVDIDVADRATSTLNKTYTAAPYAVDVLGDGRATLSYTDSTPTAHSYVLYLDGQDNGYVVETTGTHGTAGLLEAQVAGPYNYTLPGLFVSGTQYPQEAGPLTLAPHLGISGGSFSDSTGNNYVSAVVAYDTASGRGVGTFSVAGGTSYVTTYVVSGSAVRMLRLGYLLRAPSIEFVGN